MKILSWNCHGLGNPWSVRALQDWCWRERPEIVFLMETMIDAKVLEKIKNRCGFSNGVCISSVGKSGGMGFRWRDLRVDTISYSKHHYDVNVLDDNNAPLWCAVDIYGWPKQANKHYTWSLMSTLKEACSIPCIMFGDFNEVVSLMEKDGGAIRSERLMDAFRGAIDVCDLRDLGFKGSIFTWKRGTSMTTFVRERLDRFLADDNWCSMFPGFEVRHLPIYCSDHAPILLSIKNNVEREMGDKYFKFESLWLSKEECGVVVADAWGESVGADVPRKLATCAENLTSWAALSFGSIKKKIKMADKHLKVLNEGLMDAVNRDVSGADTLHMLEESYWFARARADELRDGDKNTKYFHHKENQCKAHNKIKGLYDENGDWKEQRADLERLISAYFESLFATSSPTGFQGAMEGLDCLVSDEMNVTLDTEPTGEEVKEALFQMHPNKAPGPDDNAMVAFEGGVGVFGEGDAKDGFSDVWVGRIMDCLSSVSFAFKINPRISGSVIPTRGLRQGDPISPYLFLLCADAFSTLIGKAAREKLIHGAKVCNGAPRVSHLCFSDDSILFARENVQECSVIADIINKYERVSGQNVNLSKTEVAFSKRVSTCEK
ncbi:uncharacterized protein [Spinacia oleracea]|uniref:Reverse transcriptase domain-containing protein n=1 Tax=Spinacia oleracea TaxID=3562 RepID=A0A9R0JZW4_SPIOL|nr:uncharacterized protein LOC110792038 [Spinacia oleracea]